MTRVAVVGMGHLGFSLANLIAYTNEKVYCYDMDVEKQNMINAGQNYIKDEPFLGKYLKYNVNGKRLIATTDPSYLKECDFIVICVPVPCNKKGEPQYTWLTNALVNIKHNRKQDAIVIISSTLPPRTMEKIVVTELGKERVAHVPERLTLGSTVHSINELGHIIGVSEQQVGEDIAKLYKGFVKGPIYISDFITAELVGVMDGAYRDVQIALATQFALICEEMGANYFAIRDIINKAPERMLYNACPGTGGCSIPKDSLLLAGSTDIAEFRRIFLYCRQFNLEMPLYIGNKVLQILKANNVKPIESTIGIFGVGSIPDTGSPLNSPAKTLIRFLEKANIKIILHDPNTEPDEDLKKYKIHRDMKEIIPELDAIVIMTAHKEYNETNFIDISKKMKNRIIIDCRNVIDGKQCAKDEIFYYGLGKGSFNPLAFALLP